jgi:predicted NUDIX family NTP pyrophosphohydrolase
MGNIKKLGKRSHAKASETYVDVIFTYGKNEYAWSIPIEYRRTGTDLTLASDREIDEYLEEIYILCDPQTWEDFRIEQGKFWATRNAKVTKEFFDVLNKEYKWVSVSSDLPPNSNPQRRIQDLKEFGYTLATDTSKIDSRSGLKTTHHLLLPIPRGGVRGYETWSPTLRKKIVSTLGGYDAYEASVGNIHGLLPDHKFPEIRWDEKVRRDSLEGISESEIKRDFQLLNNQRNQQKREVCRKCFQTNKRGTPFGIKFFYEGNEHWPKNLQKTGKAAEKGCVGCGWYDLEKWRQSLNKKVEGSDLEE